MESLDLVVIGAYKGKSKLSHLYASFLMACKDPSGALIPITKCGVGFDILTLETLTEIIEKT
jgi:ATP-dependent DNA ligase